ncbi:DUF1801 domain-containing protein [Flavobacterium sp. NST-5]|uniref:DUF1801 domain-containing protein n=2 Tax=Flavobacterium ichthyis TaxID=2698827 RepID=A0ABW9ZB08_9FLAO|nr:DUF1801 domain-containing protein [Flavobacterium ichthyis]
MAQNKTIETDVEVTDFLNAPEREKKYHDSLEFIKIFNEVSGFSPKMWGSSIIGFGSYHYKYNSGHEGDTPLVAFSPRKDAFALYLLPEFPEKEMLLSQLGKHKATKGCVYIKKLSDINIEILKKMLSNCIAHTKTLYPEN